MNREAQQSTRGNLWYSWTSILIKHKNLTFVMVFVFLSLGFFVIGSFQDKKGEATITYLTPGAIAYSASAGTAVYP